MEGQNDRKGWRENCGQDVRQMILKANQIELPRNYIPSCTLTLILQLA